MARPREFDEATALEAAIDCFWQRGYEATSVRDLVDKMGISGPSLYNAYGDKRSLFAQALERYFDHSARALIKQLETSLPPKQAVRRFIEEIIDRSVNDRERRGCFLINSALEVAPHDRQRVLSPSTASLRSKPFSTVQSKLAQAKGAVPRNRVARDLARLLLGVLLGIRVLARSKPERALLQGVARPALALLD